MAYAAEYDRGAKSFHWVTVALLGAQFAIGWVLLGALGLHVAAALYHHCWRRDQVLLRMLPRVG